MEIQGDSKATEDFWRSSHEQSALVINGLKLTAIHQNSLKVALKKKARPSLSGCVDIGDTFMLVTEAW